jgi:acyl dehydratase
LAGGSGFEEYVGRSTGEHVAVDPVNLPMIRRWVEAMGDTNPAYVDPAAARATGRPGTVAPAAMLPVWTTGALRATLDAPATRAPAHRAVFLALAEAGFSVTPGVNLTHRYDRELVPGDRVRASGRVAAVSGRKDTALGPAHFVDLASEYRDDDDAVVGEQVLRVVAYDPASRRRREHAATRERAPATDDGDPTDRLPVQAVTLDRLGVIACTTACNDFRAGHYDPDLARTLGMRDIFTDIPTSAGLTARYVTEWAGAAARLRTLDVALGVPFCAGDTLTFTGTVRSRARDGHCEVAVAGHTEHGRHVRATARVLIPT